MSPERPLRRLVADLSALHPDDAVAILERLDATERKRVESLLSKWSPFEAGPPLAEEPRFDATRFSPWLVARMHGRDGATTAMTREALVAGAARLYPRAPAAPPSPRAPGMFERMRGRRARP